jgi:hypothetical protein
MGSPVIAASNVRTAGAFSAGASVSRRMCSASSMRPRPIATRPRSRARVCPAILKAPTPTMNRTGATAEMLNDRTWTISVVPTLAPSISASAGTSATSPSAAKDAAIRPVAVLLWRTAVIPNPARKAVKRLRRS